MIRIMSLQFVPNGPLIPSDHNFKTINTGIVNMTGNKIINLQDPKEDQDAATKNYVDVTVRNNITLTEVNSSSYIILDSDNFIEVLYTLIGPVTLTLPETTIIGIKSFTIVDKVGNSTVNNITINCTGSDLVQSQDNIIMNQDYSSISIYSDGNGTWTIY